MSNFGFDTTGEEVVAAFPQQVKDKIFLITGPSWESIGSETAITLAKGSPSTFILLGRDIEKIQPVLDKIREIDGNIVTKFVEVHLNSLASVRKAAREILEDASIPRIDVLINNAGIMATPYSKSEDGIEIQFATNHVSHFLLTNLIMPKLLVAESPRVVNVSSFGNVLANIQEDPSFDDGKNYNSFFAYGQSKTANVLFSVGLNKRLLKKGLKAFALDPGSVPSNLRRYVTPEIMKEGMEVFKTTGVVMPPRKTPQQGCSAHIRAAIDPNLSVDGSIFLSDTKVTADPKVVASWSLDEANAEKLWEMSEDLVGEKFEY